MRFIQARNWRWANRKAIRAIVVHTMENSEKPTGAEAVAAWFALPNPAPGRPRDPLKHAPMASAHICCDSDSVIECVKPEHIAFCAPGANNDGYHIEHAGRANQTTIGWADEFSRAMLQLSAKQAAVIALRYSIPVVRLTPESLLAGEHGFCGHIDVTNAYHRSTHTDPGLGFPWEAYLGMVREALSGPEAFPLGVA